MGKNRRKAKESNEKETVETSADPGVLRVDTLSGVRGRTSKVFVKGLPPDATSEEVIRIMLLLRCLTCSSKYSFQMLVPSKNASL